MYSNSFMEFINIGPVYISGGQEGCGVEWVVAKVKIKKQDDTLVEFRVAMTSTCTHKGPIFHDRRVLTVGVISGPHC